MSTKKCLYCWAEHSRQDNYCSIECRDRDQRHERDPILTRAEVRAILDRKKVS